MPISSMEESIQNEEAQIKLYEAELAVIRQKVQNQNQDPQKWLEEKRHDDDTVLEGLFGDSNDDIVSGKESRNFLPDLLPLTGSLQQFTFTSVLRHNSPTKEDSKTSRYTLSGFFHRRSSMAVQLHLSIQMDEENQDMPDKNITSKVIHFDVGLATAAGKNDDLFRLKEISMTGSENRSLPDWIQKMSLFLDFDAHQSNTLEGWKQKYCILYEKPKPTKVVIFVMDNFGKDQHRGTNNSKASFVWEWDWETSKDALRLNDKHTFAGSKRLKPSGLVDLVACTKSCEKALELILQSRYTNS